MTDMQKLLLATAEKIKTGWELCGSKWRNTEAEVIALQTITACALNLKNHGEAFSWLGWSCTRGRGPCGTDNARGLGLLEADGSVVVESYTGPLQAPNTTAIRDGKPQVLRVTDKLIMYAASKINAKPEVV